MRELPRLLANGREPGRVAVAERVDGDARGEVEVGVAVGVPEGGALAFYEDDLWPGVGLEDVAEGGRETERGMEKKKKKRGAERVGREVE